MDQTRTRFWDEASPMSARQLPQAQYRNRVREPSEERTSYQCCEGNFNFSTAQGEDDDFYHKKKMSRDPMSHRIIEKRRRDRMNNCLADLSRLIPAEYLKKGRGRVEKTEIIEMAIKHLQHLQQAAYNNHNGVAFPSAPPSETSTAAESCAASTPATTPSSCTPIGTPSTTTSGAPIGSTNYSTTCASGATNGSAHSNTGSSSAGWEGENSEVPQTFADGLPSSQSTSTGVRPIVTEHYRLGYQECVSEAMHFLVEVEGFFACDALCVRLVNHLQRHCDRIVKGDRLNVPRSRKPGETSSSSGSSTSGVCSTNICAATSVPPHSEIRDFNNGSPLPNVPAHSYKFKNTIKQRFSDDQEERRHKRHRPNSVSPSPSGSRSPSPTIKCSPSPRLEPLPPAQTDSAAVPIFVLHSKGSFYVPLTVAYDVLAPYLYRLDIGGTVIESVQTSPRAVTPSRPASVLHPVTISVNFPQCPSERATPNPGQLALPVPPQSPANFGLPPTCCPMPAWGAFGGTG